MHIDIPQSIIDLLNEKEEMINIIRNIGMKQCIIKFTIFFVSEAFIYMNLFSNSFNISIYQSLKTIILISALIGYFLLIIKQKEQ